MSGPPAKNTVVSLWQREIGVLNHRSRSVPLSHVLLRSLRRHETLVGGDRVTTASFSADGGTLLASYQDGELVIWHWVTDSIRGSFPSGHSELISQAKFLGWSEHSIVTCSLDCEVRHFQLSEYGNIRPSLCGRHQGEANNLAVQPDCPDVFYSCGADGVVKHFDIRIRVNKDLFTCKSELADQAIIPLYAVAVDQRNKSLLAVGGEDEYARVYDIRSNCRQPVDYFCPGHLINFDVAITGLAFSDQSELLVSYSRDLIYLFTPDMGLGPDPILYVSSTMIVERRTPQVYRGHENRFIKTRAVHFFGARYEYVVSGSDCGRIYIWKKNSCELLRHMKAHKYDISCLESHPQKPLLCTSSQFEINVKIWTPRDPTDSLPNATQGWVSGSGIRDEALDEVDSDAISSEDDESMDG